MPLKLTGSKQVTVEETEFNVRPQTYDDYALALSVAEEQGLKGKARDGFISAFCIMRRITEWNVENGNGQLAECTQQYKVQLFAENPLLMNKLASGLGLMQEEKKTTGQSSRAGSSKQPGK